MLKKANTCTSKRTPPGRSRWPQRRARSGDPPHFAGPSRRGIGYDSPTSTTSSARAHPSGEWLVRRGRSPDDASARSRRFAASSGCGSVPGRSPRHQLPCHSLRFASLPGRCMWCVSATRWSRSPSALLRVREVRALVHAFADELHGGALRPGTVLRCPLIGRISRPGAEGSRTTVRWVVSGIRPSNIPTARDALSELLPL